MPHSQPMPTSPLPSSPPSRPGPPALRAGLLPAAGLALCVVVAACGDGATEPASIVISNAGTAGQAGRAGAAGQAGQVSQAGKAGGSAGGVGGAGGVGSVGGGAGQGGAAAQGGASASGEGGASGAQAGGAAGAQAGAGGGSAAGGGEHGGSGGEAGASGEGGAGGSAQAGSGPAAGEGGSGGQAEPPDIGTVPWSGVGLGVAFKEAPGASGHAAFLGYAGYGVQQPWAEAWVDELYRAHLRSLGVRYLYAIQGPQDPGYQAKEIGNSKLIAHLSPHLSESGDPIIVAAHSSGSFVAHELFYQLFDKQLDGGQSAGRVVYFNLDGGSSGLAGSYVAAMRKAYFVWAQDGGTSSPNASTMQALAGQFADKGGGIPLDAGASGCNAGAPWCVHMTLITDHPHNPADASVEADYASFDPQHPATFSYLTLTEEAWLAPEARPRGGTATFLTSPWMKPWLVLTLNGPFSALRLPRTISRRSRVA